MPGRPGAEPDAVVDACRAALISIEPAARVLVGYSGGLDSTVLLHALAGLTEAAGPRLEAVHVNHGLVPESRLWQQHCERFAATLGVPLHSQALSVEPGTNLEARARDARYAVFEACMRRGDYLLLAHHQQDRTETALLHLLQGRGLYALPGQRAIGAGVLLRPLLELPRAALGAHAAAHDLDWIEDVSNADTTHDRAFLRHRVLPDLRDRFDNLDARIGRVLREAQSRSDLLFELLELDRTVLPIDWLLEFPRHQQLAILRGWLIRQGLGGALSDAALSGLLEWLPGDANAQLESDLLAIRRLGAELHLTPPTPALDPQYLLEVPGRLLLPHGELYCEPAGEGGCARRGERLRVCFPASLPAAELELRGRLRPVRELLREAGVPRWERRCHPLLLDDAGVLAVPGVAVRDRGATARSAPAGDQFQVVWRLRRSFSR